MRSIWMLLAMFVVSIAPSMVRASELAEALVKLRASFARTAFSHFKAMPLHIRHKVEVGEVIRIQDEQRLIESLTCYPDLDVEIDDGEEVASVSLSRKSAVLVGLGGEAPVYGIPSSMNAEFERSIRRNVQSVLIQSSVSYPQMGVVEMSSPSGTDPACLKLLPPAYIPMGPGLLVSTVIEGSLVTRQSIDRNLAATIDASAKLTPRGLPVEVSGNVDTSSSTRSVIAQLRPEGSFAVQSAFISRRVLMEYYALANNDPDTWAELEALIESYISGEEPGIFANVRTGILWLWEKLDQPEESLMQYRERLFASEDVQFVPKVEDLDLPEDAWSRLGTIAAAAEIASTTIEN